MRSEIRNRVEELLPYGAAFALIMAMVGAAAALGDREIILPEIAAMAVALWAWREQSWMRQPEKIFIWPSLTAVMGFGINLLALPFAAKLVLVLVAMLGFFAFLRYSLAPALATGFLPIVTNATHPSFLVSIGVTTFILMAGIFLFRVRSPADRRAPLAYRAMLAYLVTTLASIGLAAAAGYPHLGVIPPVAVVVYESLHMKMYAPRMALRQIAVLTLAASIGIALIALFESWLVIALLDLLLMTALLRLFGMRVPAVYAFPFLPFVFPTEALRLLPLATAMVSAFSLGLVLACRRWLTERASAVAVA
ncbi:MULTISPECIES: hypothetical protein [Sphingomonadaceae]|uniref:HPP family protein n=1 Tax=Sphingobium cupriresistens TaxID=1132417 RepID=A0A8G1ZD53_9SPHN|nr:MULTISPECIES: hypothetical protein [Sphingomonadaceae]MBN2974159.1 hypothetical protein [Roseomonas aeriglobus]MDF0491225.1 hypothetical protein [Sphingomonas pollutisoli]RYM07082.1 hypothetical protein EWH12_19405 [Sphingobium cupriresistens]